MMSVATQPPLQFLTRDGGDFLLHLQTLELMQLSVGVVLAISVPLLFWRGHRIFVAGRLRASSFFRKHPYEATGCVAGGQQCRTNSASPRGRGIASLEFLLVLIPLFVIVMAFVQIALMINARLHVGYAAYAAARSASVVVYAESDEEEIGVLLNSDAEGAEKWQRINRATAPALLPISPGSPAAAAKAFASFSASQVIDDESFGGVDFDIDATATAGRLTAMVVHRAGDAWQGKRLQRAAVKSVYTDLATTVWINDRNAEGELRDGTEDSEPFDLSEEDTLSVSVDYEFWLNVPYAGRAMKLAFEPEWILQSRFLTPTLTLSDTVVVPAWRKRKAF
jgi:hypothetical protein